MSRTVRSPEKCAAALSRELAEAKREGRARIRRYLGTLVDESGWKKRSAPRMRDLASALRDKGLTTSIDITDLSVPLDAWVGIARSPFPTSDVGARFSHEDCLNDYLKTHHEDAFVGVVGLEGLRLIGSEVHVDYDGEDLYADLVFEDPSSPSGPTVVVELEKGDPPDGAVGQLRGYLNAHRQRGTAALKGVLITGVPDSPQHELDILDALDGLRTDFPVEWYTYQVAVTLQRVD